MTNLKRDAASTEANDEPVLTELELKRLAELFNVLMEVDFYINRKHKELIYD